MVLASIAFNSTYKSWHCVTSIKITFKKLLTKIHLQKITRMRFSACLLSTLVA